MTDVDFSQFGRASAGENLTSRQTIAQRQNRKQSERARIEDSIARHQIVQGQFLVSGVGELAKEVVFPVKFIEKPLLSFGGELAENSSPTDGGFPTISVVVGGWNLEIPGETNQETPDKKRS